MSKTIFIATRGSALSKALGKQGFYHQVDLPQGQAYDFAVERMATASLTARHAHLDREAEVPD